MLEHKREKPTCKSLTSLSLIPLGYLRLGVVLSVWSPCSNVDAAG